MTLITHKSYLGIFYNALVKQAAKKISYNRKEAIAALEADTSLIDRICKKSIDAVYNFISIGYLIEAGDLAHTVCEETSKKSILSLFREVLTRKTTFYVTIDAMIDIYVTGKAIVPLIGAVNLAPDARVPYLERFERYIGEESREKIKIINSAQPKIAALCLQGMSLIYSGDHDYVDEKIHCFETDAINGLLKREVAENSKIVLDFSPDLWAAYIDQLSEIH